MSEYTPGIYAKEGRPDRHALTVAEAVSLSFEGYRPKVEAPVVVEPVVEPPVVEPVFEYEELPAAEEIPTPKAVARPKPPKDDK